MTTEEAPAGRPRVVGHRWRRPGLVSRMLMLHAIVFMAAMAVVLLLVSQAVNTNLIDAVNTGMVEEMQEFGHAANLRPPSQPLNTFAVGYLRTRLFPHGTTVLVRLAGGEVLGTAGANQLRVTPAIAHWLLYPPRTSLVQPIRVGGGTDQVLASAITGHGHVLGTLVIATDLASVRHQAAATLVAVAAEAAAALIIAIATAYVILHRALQVVDRVAETARTIGREDLGRRLDPTGSDDEVGRLVGTFNDMLSRLETAFRQQRQLLSDVSHQLRTPLTVIRGHLEVLARSGRPDPAETHETVELVLDELTHTAALVDHLLLLGRALEPDFLQLEPVALRPFLTDVLTAAQALGSRHWTLSVTTDATVLVDRTKLRGVLLNLLDNAAAATAPGDSITLAAEMNEGIALEVIDTGRGIPPAEQERLFQRFQRLPASGGRGAGLGLAIVKAVAEAHGGQVRLQSVEGAGTTVGIVLPAGAIVPPGTARSTRP